MHDCIIINKIRNVARQFTVFSVSVINGNNEGSSKSFRTFIFSQETVRAGGVVIGSV